MNRKKLIETMLDFKEKNVKSIILNELASWLYEEVGNIEGDYCLVLSGEYSDRDVIHEYYIREYLTNCSEKEVVKFLDEIYFKSDKVVVFGGHNLVENINKVLEQDKILFSLGDWHFSWKNKFGTDLIFNYKVYSYPRKLV